MQNFTGPTRLPKQLSPIPSFSTEQKKVPQENQNEIIPIVFLSVSLAMPIIIILLAVLLHRQRKRRARRAKEVSIEDTYSEPSTERNFAGHQIFPLDHFRQSSNERSNHLAPPPLPQFTGDRTVMSKPSGLNTRAFIPQPLEHHISTTLPRNPRSDIVLEIPTAEEYTSLPLQSSSRDWTQTPYTLPPLSSIPNMSRYSTVSLQIDDVRHESLQSISKPKNHHVSSIVVGDQGEKVT
ncbi:hypothetical protein BU24DRAFT_481651 [Aaosphaeria arxii CBS 175.79]|uniref:Uncharacterized protein n=1 Tax=Aaosphaeria arxii CBS 175.79 TaxID=1450172 RepID=A0A6A5XMU7_9PLEO|nr:uncharacterized protein BU24DRAFT_481651 [Aaosphaeria arxii CBS 175.79]KAF2014236.1 hypothetical protein BU24DRAFT_481651 [Aaosphaeria arxii CBS 175.79]